MFGSKLGWERPNWFAGAPGAFDEPSMDRASWFGPVGDEHRAVSEAAGLFDQPKKRLVSFTVADPDVGGDTHAHLTEGAYELVVANERVPAILHIQPLDDPGGPRIRS